MRTKKQRQEFFQPLPPEKISLKQAGLVPVEVKKAIKRIKKAVRKKEKVIVYGDYDADGVCATALVWETLRICGADVLPFIPTREEGYGLKVDRLSQMAKKGVQLVVTVDQGIVHGRQVAHAKKIGLDIIVTDHHLKGKKKPRAVAVVHTTHLAGVGVAWFLCRKLLKAFGKKKKASLDLVAIGTITDMVPLLGVNRSLVKQGLKSLRKTKRIGLDFLYQLANLEKEKIGTYEIGFIIGPRINASGRVKDPMDSLRLLCLKRDEEKALVIAKRLNENNRERQLLTSQAAIDARRRWLDSDEKGELIFVQGESYHEGVIGLVAQKLSREFYRPAIVVSYGKQECRASARSIKEFNIVEAIRTCSDLLVSYGGHPLAAGFTVETKKLTLLKSRLQTLAGEQLKKGQLKPTLKIDTEVALADLTSTLLEKFNRFEPFGIGNPAPVLVSRRVKVMGVRTVGSNGQHLKLQVMAQDSGAAFETIGFGLGDRYSQLSPEKPIDIVYQLTLNEWNGHRSLQLKLKDIKISG